MKNKNLLNICILLVTVCVIYAMYLFAKHKVTCLEDGVLDSGQHYCAKWADGYGETSK